MLFSAMTSQSDGEVLLVSPWPPLSKERACSLSLQEISEHGAVILVRPIKCEHTQADSTLSSKLPNSSFACATTRMEMFLFHSFLSDHLACGDASWSYRRGSCYKLVRQHKSYLAAAKHCKQLQSYLVEIQNENENRFVTRLHHDQDIWIGLSDRQKEGQWIWETSRRLVNFTRWSPGEPNNKGGGNGRAHCALIWRHHHLETWDDRNCDQRKYFVCERGKNGGTLCALRT